ncbi:hypothetical protein LXL04_037981 [Taraxacum kok-saghyz]
MTGNHNHDDASSMKRIKTCENHGVATWSDLNHDVLFLVMMQLGVIDFLAFGGVCKSWRLLTVSNKNKFMASRPPMSISISTDANEKECYLDDSEGRKFKTILPHSTGRKYVGLTCGYLILFDAERKDFWLVNPITRHELYFPRVPTDDPYIFKVILVFSPSISESVLVRFSRCINKIWFCMAGKQKWGHVSISYFIHDLRAFKGKIYALHSFPTRLSEVRLYPTPKVTLLEIKNFPQPYCYPMFISSCENLYMMDPFKDSSSKIHEIDFSKMECVSGEKTGKEFAIFFSMYSHVDYVIGSSAQLWADFHSQYLVTLQNILSQKIHSRYRIFFVDRKCPKPKIFYGEMWYFFHECLNVNLLCD